MELFNFKNTTKGENGTILVIGGSDYYVGAPYFAALSSFKTGADCVYIFSFETAIYPLKVLLPEAVITLIKFDERILKKVNCCILGPGLGNIENELIEKLKEILQFLDKRCIPFIIDGDAIRYVVELGLAGMKKVIYTPNFKEYKHLKNLTIDQFILLKGSHDSLYYNEVLKEKVFLPFCEKRCSGQGDILTGILAVFLCKVSITLLNNAILGSMRAASKVLREAGHNAYLKHGRSTMSRNILEELQGAVDKIVAECFYAE